MYFLPVSNALLLLMLMGLPVFAARGTPTSVMLLLLRPMTSFHCLCHRLVQLSHPLCRVVIMPLPYAILIAL
jgi:hypothetical protein